MCGSMATKFDFDFITLNQISQDLGIIKPLMTTYHSLFLWKVFIFLIPYDIQIHSAAHCSPLLQSSLGMLNAVSRDSYPSSESQ